MDLIRYSPLFGPVVPLDDVADPVFTRRRVSDGQRMSKGDLLVEFDVDMIARTAKSRSTVVPVANDNSFHQANPSNILNDYECSFLC